MHALKRWWPKGQTSVTEWLLVCLTLLYCVVSFFQWQAMRQSNIGSQRAWITVKSISSVGVLDVESKERLIAVFFENTGHSPANEVLAEPQLLVTSQMKLPIPPPYKGPCDCPEQSVGVIGNGQTFPAVLDVHDVTAAHVDAIKAAKMRLFVYGRVRYKDAFGYRRTTTFCSVWNRAQSLMQSCPYHNSAE